MMMALKIRTEVLYMLTCLLAASGGRNLRAGSSQASSLCFWDIWSSRICVLAAVIKRAAWTRVLSSFVPSSPSPLPAPLPHSCEWIDDEGGNVGCRCETLAQTHIASRKHALAFAGWSILTSQSYPNHSMLLQFLCLSLGFFPHQ